jgi:hypothetical protein
MWLIVRQSTAKYGKIRQNTPADAKQPLYFSRRDVTLAKIDSAWRLNLVAHSSANYGKVRQQMQMHR